MHFANSFPSESALKKDAKIFHSFPSLKQIQPRHYMKRVEWFHLSMIQLNLGDTQGVRGRGVGEARFQVQRPSGDGF